MKKTQENSLNLFPSPSALESFSVPVVDNISTTVIHLRDLPETETREIPTHRQVRTNCNRIVIPVRAIEYNNGNKFLPQYKRDADVCMDCLRKHIEVYEGRTFALEAR